MQGGQEKLRLKVKVAGESAEADLEVQISREGSVPALKFAVAAAWQRAGRAFPSGTNAQLFAQRCRLIFAGRLLDDALPLADYAMPPTGGVLHLVPPALEQPDGAAAGGGPAPQRAREDSGAGSKEGGGRGGSSSAANGAGAAAGAAREGAVPCEARRADGRWVRGERGVKTAAGWRVVFGPGDEADVRAADVRVRPQWWRALREEDVISLEPLARLRHEPFQLDASDAKPYYFDGKVRSPRAPPSFYSASRPFARLCDALPSWLLNLVEGGGRGL
jgi:hypothetical protein